MHHGLGRLVLAFGAQLKEVLVLLLLLSLIVELFMVEFVECSNRHCALTVGNMVAGTELGGGQLVAFHVWQLDGRRDVELPLVLRVIA